MAARNKREAQEQAGSAIKKWAQKFASVAWISGSQYTMTVGDLTVATKVGIIYQINENSSKAGEVSAAVALGVTKAIGQALIHYDNDCSLISNRITYINHR